MASKVDLNTLQTEFKKFREEYAVNNAYIERDIRLFISDVLYEYFQNCNLQDWKDSLKSTDPKENASGLRELAGLWPKNLVRTRRKSLIPSKIKRKKWIV